MTRRPGSTSTAGRQKRLAVLMVGVTLLSIICGAVGLAIAAPPSAQPDAAGPPVALAEGPESGIGPLPWGAKERAAEMLEPRASRAAVSAAEPLESAAGAGGRRVGWWPRGPAWEVAVDASRNLAFVRTGLTEWYGERSEHRVIILDMSGLPASAPAVIAELSIDGLTGLRYANNFLYLGTSTQGIRIFNVADPAHPTEVGSFATAEYAARFFVAGQSAYVVTRSNENRLTIFAVADPAHPVPVGVFDAPSAVTDLYVAAGIAYVTTSTDGLRIINVADPAHPAELGALATPDIADRVFVDGQVAYLANHGAGLTRTIRMVDVANPAQPIQLGSHPITTWSVTGIHATANTAYVTTTDTNGLRIIDFANPADPVEIALTDPPSSTTHITGTGTTAYVTTIFDGLRVFDLTDPKLPTETGFFDTNSAVVGVHAAGGYAYLVDAYGLWVIDVRRPAHPAYVGSVATAGPAEGVYVAGQTAYVACGRAGLRIINVADPARPNEVGALATASPAWSVFVVGKTAYVASGNAGLRIIDVTDPVQPVQVGVWSTPKPAVGVFVKGQTAYVACGRAGLRIIDVSHPARPAEIGAFATAGPASSVFVVNKTAYVAADGLHIVNVRDPLHPEELGYHAAREAGSVAVAGNYAYFVTTWCGKSCTNGVEIVDVSDSAHPTTAGSYTFTYLPIFGVYGVQVVGDYAYVVGGPWGMGIFRRYAFGAVKVTLKPGDCVAAGAKWRVDHRKWQESGVTVAGLKPGRHTIRFKQMPGWNRPPARRFTITKDRRKKIVGTYTH